MPQSAGQLDTIGVCLSCCVLPAAFSSAAPDSCIKLHHHQGMAMSCFTSDNSNNNSNKAPTAGRIGPLVTPMVPPLV
jgi:hypothetical protein